MNRSKNKYNRKTLDPIYKFEDINIDYYEKIKDVGTGELEHQIGRLVNFKNIVQACTNLGGDFIEFGTWKGFSLLWSAYFMERNALFDRKLVGLDGFKGLPADDGVFKRGSFADASLKLCENNVLNNSFLYEDTRKNICIGKFLFKEKEKIITYLAQNNVEKVCFIHIDCDVYQSVIEIFDILNDGDIIADMAYILFDDYGWESKLSSAVDSIFECMKSKWEISVHSSTCYTKNFLLVKK